MLRLALVRSFCPARRCRAAPTSTCADHGSAGRKVREQQHTHREREKDSTTQQQERRPQLHSRSLALLRSAVLSASQATSRSTCPNLGQQQHNTNCLRALHSQCHSSLTVPLSTLRVPALQCVLRSLAPSDRALHWRSSEQDVAFGSCDADVARLSAASAAAQRHHRRTVLARQIARGASSQRQGGQMSEHSDRGGGDRSIVSRHQLAHDLRALAQRSCARKDSARLRVVPAVRHKRGCGAVRVDQR